MQTISKKEKQSRAKVVSSVVLLQQLAAIAPAMANGSFAQHLSPQISPLNHVSAAHFSPSAASSGWHAHQVNPAVVSGMGAANFLPASFGVGVSTLPMTAHTAALSQNAHIQHQQNPAFLQHVSAQAVASLPAQAVQLDLTSASASVTVTQGLIKHGGEVTVQVGGAAVTYRAGDKITAGELVAIEQAQGKAGQTIQLDNQGRASGGTFSLNSVSANNNGLAVASVVVPANVTALDRVVANKSINLSGDLVNYGSILETGHGHGGAANINALDIVNQAGASITTSGGGKSGLDLNLTAVQDFTNNGTISSSGNLFVSAGGSLSNVAASGQSAVPALKATGDVNLQSGNITNNGLIAASTGNVNLGTAGDQVMNINNAGGTVSAQNGAINLRAADYAGVSNTNVVGGDLLSQNVNLNSGGGTIDVNVGQLTGRVASTGNAVHVKADTRELKLGSQILSGDPTYFNNGDIALDGDYVVGEDLAIIATGSIIADANVHTIQATNMDGSGANIVMLAGVDGTTDGTTITLNGAGSGGTINLLSADPALLISAAATSANKSGGNITLAAFTSSNSGGQVFLPNSSKIDASGTGTGVNGDVTILAGFTDVSDPNAPAINIGQITGASNVTMSSSQPTLKNSGPITFNYTGQVTNGNAIVRDFSQTDFGAIYANGSITATKNIDISGNGVAISGLAAGNSVFVTSSSGGIGVDGSIKAGIGGIALIAGGSISNPSNNKIDIDTSSALGGGEIVMIAGAAFYSVDNGVGITGASASGGFIRFDSDTTSFTTKGTSASAAGGNVLLLALDSTDAPGTNGYVTITSTLAITTGGGSSTAASGNVIVEGTAPGGHNSIGDTADGIQVDTSGGKAGTGNVRLYSGLPDFTAPISVFNGSVNVDAPVLIGSLAGGDINYSKITTNNGSSSLYKGGDLSLDASKFFNTNILVLASGDVFSGAISSKNSVTLTSNSNVYLNGDISATGGLLVAARNDVLNGAAIKITTHNNSGNAGNITLVAGADFTLGTTGVTINGASANGGFVDLSYSGVISELDSYSLGAGSKGGDITLLAFQGASSGSGVVQLPVGLIVTTGSTSGGSGNITIIGGQIDPTAASIYTGALVASGGAVATATSGTILLESAQPDASTPIVYGLNGALQSGNPVVLITTGTFTQGIIATGALNSKGGNVLVASAGDLEIDSIDVSGVAGLNNGSGGSVFIHNTSTNALFIGNSSASNYVGFIDATSDETTTGSGGYASISASAGIAVVAGSFAFAALGTNAVKGGSLLLDAGDNAISLGGIGIVATAASTPLTGGTISLSGSSVTNTTGGSLQFLAPGSVQGGSVTLSVTDDTPIQVGTTTGYLFNASGGGSVTIKAPNAPISMFRSGINVDTAFGGNGGSIYIESKGFTNLDPSTTFAFDLNGSVQGNGGHFTFIDHANQNFVFGKSAGNFQVGVNGGLVGVNNNGAGDAGSITFTTEGSILVDTTSATAAVRNTSGNGGSFSFIAGGNLLINGSLVSDAKGVGKIGGNIDLESNSGATFIVDSGTAKSINGITGTISAIGSGVGGHITIVNEGGAIQNKQELAGNFGSLDETGEGLTFVGKTIGGPGAYHIGLYDHNTEANKPNTLNLTVTVQATDVHLEASGPITANKLNASTLSFHGGNNVTVTNLSTNDLTIKANQAPGDLDNYGRIIKIITAGNLIVNEMVDGTGNVTMQAGTKSPFAGITINDTVSAYGNVYLTAKGGIAVDGDIKGISNVVISSTSVGDVRVSKIVSADAGPVNIKAANGNVVLTPTSNISADSAILVSAVKGYLTTGDLKAGGAVTLTSAFTQHLDGNVAFNTGFTAKTTAKTNGSYDIIIGGNIASSSKTGTLTLTTSDGGSITDADKPYDPMSPGSGVHLVGATVSLDGAKGISLLNTSIYATYKSLDLSSDSGNITVGPQSYVASFNNATTIKGVNVTINGQASGCTALNITGTGKGLDGSVTVGDQAMISANGDKGEINVIANGGTGINVGFFANVDSEQDLNFTANNSSITTSVLSNLTSEQHSVIFKADNDLFDYGTVNAARYVSMQTLTPSTTTQLRINGDITASNGYVSIIGKGGSVVIAPDTTVKAVGNSFLGAIVIEDANVAKGNKSSVGILGTIATSGKLGSDVTISIGASKSKNAVASIDGFDVTQTGSGKLYVGTTPSAIVADPGNPMPILITKNANLIINSPSAANVITFYSGSSVTADPPSAVSAPHVDYLTAATAKVTGDANGYAPLAIQSTQSPFSVAASLRPVSFSSVQPYTAAMQGINGAVVYDLSGGQQSAVDSNSGYASSSAPTWISDTEQADGRISAVVLKPGSADKAGKGSFIYAPTVDTTVETKFGNVKLKAGSLAVVMVFARGLAVYNLHDRGRRAVVVECGGRNLTLSPGRSALVTSNLVQGFEHVNPAQLVCYGDMSEVNLEGSLKVFHGEFSVPSMINAVPTLTQLLTSKQAADKRVANEFLKTTSILMQSRGGWNNCKQMLRPQVTALN